MGTAAYYSPEGINRANRLDDKVVYGLKHDVYASGIILLALLAETSTLFNVELIYGPRKEYELRPHKLVIDKKEEIKDKIISDLGNTSNDLFTNEIRKNKRTNKWS